MSSVFYFLLLEYDVTDIWFGIVTQTAHAYSSFFPRIIYRSWHIIFILAYLCFDRLTYLVATN